MRYPAAQPNRKKLTLKLHLMRKRKAIVHNMKCYGTIPTIGRYSITRSYLFFAQIMHCCKSLWIMRCQMYAVILTVTITVTHFVFFIYFYIRNLNIEFIPHEKPRRDF